MQGRRRALSALFASRSVVGLAFGAFVVLGMPKTAFGVAWPTVATDLQRSIAELGVIIVVFTGAYLTASAVSGPVSERVGTGTALVAANLATTVALVGYAAVPTWALLLAAAVVLGISGGIVDAGINAFMAVNRGPRMMNLLHASFGVGATLGPLLMTGILAFGGSWRSAYAVLAVLQGLITVAFWRTRREWDADVVAGGRSGRGAERPQTALLWTGLSVFFLYSGIEVGAGVWAASLFTEGRGIGETAAGLAVTGYWASFTLGRFAASAVGDGFRPEAVVPRAGVAAAAGLALLWWSPLPWLGPAALIVVGFALAPIFPALVLLTPPRLGAGFVRRAVGYQLAAASLGIAAIPGAAGLLVAWSGLEAVAPFLLLACLALLIMNRAVSRMTQRPQPQRAPIPRPRPPAGR